LDIPPNAKIFTADTTAMYTNFHTATGIETINNLISSHTVELPTNFPANFFLLVLETIMNANIFNFGDTFGANYMAPQFEPRLIPSTHPILRAT
jgi:hypothetical protein